MKQLLSLVKTFHKKYVYERRVRVLSEIIIEHIPDNALVLDVGCGDGTIGYLLKQKKPSVTCIGLEVTNAFAFKIPHKLFDGQKIPFHNNEVDVCLFIDVLHHTQDMSALLNEAKRVAKHSVIIKDHVCETKYDFLMLKIMDWIGNKPHGIDLPYNYKSKKEWEEIFRECGLKKNFWTTNIPLYRFPLKQVCGRKLHFVACLEKIQ